ncbi:MAG: OprD family outer membrane porin [Campylobacteraceae bacterium]|nr:OprD family outer membrane porin [Campylobacteraceae bacterium]
MKVLKNIFLLTAFGVSSYAADSLADAFKNGETSGVFRTYYFDQKVGDDKADILDFALRLNYTTDFYYGFKAAVTFQGVSTPFADKNAKNFDAFRSINGVYGPGAVMSEAYLSYAFSKTTIKIGRQFINMPLVGGGMGKPIVQSFEGATIKSDELNDTGTTLYAAYIDKYQFQTGKNGNAPKFFDLADSNPNIYSANAKEGYAIGARNNYFDGLDLSIGYGMVVDDFDIFYTEAKYKNSIGDMGIRYNLAGQLSGTAYDDSSKDDALFYGLKLGLGYSGFDMYGAFGEIKGGNAQFGVAGGLNKCLLFTSSYEACALYSESSQYAFGASYNLNRLLGVGLLKIGAVYSDMDFEQNQEEIKWTDIYVEFAPGGIADGVFKKIFMRATYEKEDYKLGNDADIFILRFDYSF